MTVTPSTWREQDVLLNQNNETPIYFPDTFPNHIVFTNNTDSPIYVSVSPMVSPTFYEMLVPVGATKVFARDKGFSQLYVYHASDIAYRTKVISFEAPFTPQSIQQSQEIINVQQLTGDMNVTSLPSLPAGNAKIGKVEVPDGVSLAGATIPDSQAVPVRNAGTTALATASLTVLAKTELTTGDVNLVGRKQLIVYPPSSGTLYWGNDGVTVSTGAPLVAGDSPLVFDFDPTNPLKIYGISDVSVSIRVVESK